MKICFINAPVGTVSGSQESVVFYMAECLSKDHEVTIITGRERRRPILDRFKNASFQVITVPYWSRYNLKNKILSKIHHRLHTWKIESLTLYLGVIIRPGIKRIIRESDVIVTYYRLDSRLFSNLAYKYGVPCVSNFQFAAYSEKFFKIDKSVIYLANSRFSKESLERERNVKIHGVVTPGVSGDFFVEKGTKIPEISAQTSLIFVGNLRKQKGIFELIDMFQEVLRSHEDCKLFIIGSGEKKEALVEKIQTLQLSHKVRLMGEIKFEDMPSFYRSAAILVHPSHEETFGMVVLEAMACGLPVIASDLPSISELSDGAAILIPLNNQSLWVEKINYLLENPNIRDEMSKQGIIKAKQHLWEEKAKQLEYYLKKAAQ